MMNDNNEHKTGGPGGTGPDTAGGGTQSPGQPGAEQRIPPASERPTGGEQRPPVLARGPLAPGARRLSGMWLNIIAAAVTLAVCILITATYQSRLHKRLIAEGIGSGGVVSTEGFVPIRVFYPSRGGLVPEERLVPPSELQTRVVESAVLEYLKGPTGDAVSYVPEGTRLLGLYRGSDDIIYMDLSHEFRSNFQGDAYGEFLLLRGLYESVMSNAEDITGLKVLIEGKDVDTIGGHISLQGTLGSVVSSTMLEGYEDK